MTAAVIALAAALASSYSGATDEGSRIDVALDGNHVTRVSTTVADYECARFGQIGPLRIKTTEAARINSRGRFAFVTGDRAERIGIAGRVRRTGVVTGRIRVSGTIATGERCVSNTVRFAAR